MAKILVTSALPYINNIPHLGNLIGAVLSADVYARHKRLQGHEVLYVCGADEHGTATEKKAKEEGVTPKELCDEYGKLHKEIYDWFGIEFDIWGRTHTQAQEEIVHDIFHKLDENGYITQKEVKQLYDTQAKQFLADRFVEGECPHCHASGARGDQCDACGQLIEATNLINPVSILSNSKPEIRTSNHLFLDLEKLAPLLKQFYNDAQPTLSKNAQVFTDKWIDQLEARAITRDLEWGIPVPKQGFEDKVFYVWFDAPIGYISITAQHKKNWESWWKTNDVELHQFMAKDNIVFHSILFPAALLGSGDEYTLLSGLNATEYLTLENAKFSKSRQEGVFGDDAIAIEDEYGISADAWRYALIANRPETSDATFSFQEFQNRVNNELIATLANFANRTIHFAYAHLQDEHEATLAASQEAFIEQTTTLAKKATTLLDNKEMRKALKTVMRIAKQANQYFQKHEPWKTIKENKQQAAADIQALLTVLKDLSILIHPYMPQTAKKIRELLHEKQDLTYEDIGELTDLRVQEPEILFEKIEDDTIMELTKEYTPETHPLNLQVAQVTEALEHPNADKLYVLKIDLGDETRQLVAGLKGHYTPEELTGKHIVVVTNLQEATLRGEKSQGMLLASEDADGTVGILHTDAQPGTQLTVNDTKPNSNEITFNEFTKLKLKSTPEGVFIDEKELTGATLVVDKDAYGKIR